VIPPPRLRRLKLTALALAATLSALAWTVVSGGPAPAPAEPYHRRDVPLADVAPWGANFFLEREVEAWNEEQTVEWAAAAGIRWAKQHFPWYDIEREPGDFRWAKYDRIVDLYRSRGIEVVARLDFPAKWVTPARWVPPEKHGPPINSPPADPDDYARFVAAVVEHFKGRVRFYQIWNEPNLFTEWGFDPAHPVDPAEYVELLAAAAAAARGADPNVVILTAPLAFNFETVELRGNMSDVDYLRGMYEAGAAEHFDVLSVNAFGIERPPEDPPDEAALNFRRVELQRRIMEEAGDRCTPVWAAEYGWNAAPEGVGSMWGGVGEEDQAAWTVAGVDYARTYWPWSGVFSIWFFRHPDAPPEDAVYHFRMVDPDFTHRRVYTAVQAAAAPPAVAGPGEWAERSAPVRLDRLDDWVWAWDAPAEARGPRRLGCAGEACCRAPDDRAVDASYLASAASGARLAFRFRGAAVAVRAKTLSQVASLSAEVNGRETSVLLKEADGWQWHALADNLPGGVHELTLALGGAGGRVAVDGFRVGEGPPSDPRRWWALLLGAAAAALAVVLVIDVRYVASRLRWR